MKVFSGKIEKGNGVASCNLRHVAQLIGNRIGIPDIIKGTLNVRIDEPYKVPPDATVLPHEYNDQETLKLKRCRIRGIRCCIMRPDFHEMAKEPKQLKDALTRLEIMSDRKLRDALNLEDGDPVNVEIDGDNSWWLAPSGEIKK